MRGEETAHGLDVLTDLRNQGLPRGEFPLRAQSPKEFKFEAGGKSYKMYDKISLARKIEQDKLLVEIMNGMTISDQLKDWRKCYDLFNGQKFADGVVVCYNAMERLKA